MSWITAIWSATAAVCLTLAGVHFLVWVKSRASWANLLFSIAATSAAACAVFELALMHAQTPAQFGELLRWFHVPLAVMVVSLIWFVRQHPQSGRLWLVWLFCGMRVVTLVLTFSLDPNLNFREITGLHSISARGETIVSPLGVKNPRSGRPGSPKEKCAKPRPKLEIGWHSLAGMGDCRSLSWNDLAAGGESWRKCTKNVPAQF